MDYSQTPLWMQDDLVKDIPREKLEFLSTLFAKGHGKSQKEMMALLMPAMRKAKQEHLTFTPQEMHLPTLESLRKPPPLPASVHPQTARLT